MDSSVCVKVLLNFYETIILRGIRTVDSDLIGDHPFLGCSLSLPDYRIPGSYRDWELHAMREMRKRYPNEHLFKTFMGPITVAYWVCTADGAQSVLKNQEFDDKDFRYRFFEPWLGEGLVVSNGQKWHTRRKMLTASFHYSILDSFREQMVELTQAGFYFDVYCIISHWCLIKAK